MNILVVGGGAWGTAISYILASNHHKILIWSKNEKVVESINRSSTNQVYFPLINLPSNIEATLTVSSLDSIDVVFIVIPSVAVRNTVEHLQKIGIRKDIKIVICSKGIEINSLKLMSEIVAEILPNDYAVLSGPNFANEVMQEKMTVSLCASTYPEMNTFVSKLMMRNHFLVLPNNQLIRIQVASAIKNIIAIACGIIEGADLGNNLKAAVLSCGHAEINQFIKLRGYKESKNSETESIDLCGIGDLMLTCCTPLSRNMRYGYEIGRYGVVKVANKIGLVEGVNTVKSLKSARISLPIIDAVHSIVSNRPLNTQGLYNLLYNSILKHCKEYA
ncbi:MAG: glycerol-3-phosphate dehydrogenase [NAD(P)+] [Candidatus Xenolissoclinum pacificiensis L6]|uniref:Glycerol-3-phosphate dehydrogenase [NAD(P)+] n=1 Tax=Candidatus Xenolissoclinum pacificiensis L6 TaxID=1401685 RepID=W2V392_9RICK|nr:MAG: glycerol-3-phosphate dehydrogenase [NAD(P)+] [Candidatus Xenolissoclinum pacificiensis L6]